MPGVKADMVVKSSNAQTVFIKTSTTVNPASKTMQTNAGLRKSIVLNLTDGNPANVWITAVLLNPARTIIISTITIVKSIHGIIAEIIILPVAEPTPMQRAKKENVNINASRAISLKATAVSTVQPRIAAEKAVPKKYKAGWTAFVIMAHAKSLNVI